MKLTRRVSRIAMSPTAAVLAAATKLRAEGIDVVDFGPGEPDFPTPESVKQAAVDAIRSDFTKYTATDGISDLKRAIVERHSRDFGTNYQPDEVLVTVGGKQAIFNLVSAIVEPGDDVILPVPYWGTFKDVVHYAGGTCILVPTADNKNFRLHGDQVLEALTPRARLIILNSPNNPSGAVVPEAQMRTIAEMACERGILILSDECYCHFVYDAIKPFSVASLGERYRKNLLVVGSLSKTYSMTGWRVGYCLGPAEVIGPMLKIQSHCTSNACSISQKAAVSALSGPQDSIQQMLEEYSRRRSYIVQALNSIPDVHCNWPDGAFYVYANVSSLLRRLASTQQPVRTPSDLAVRLLREAHLAVVPGEAFGTKEHIRISYATSMKQLEKGVQRLEDFLTRSL